MRFSTSHIGAVVLAAVFTACSAGGGISNQSGSLPGAGSAHVPISLVPDSVRPVGVQRLKLGFVYPDKKKASGGIYGSEFYGPGSGEGMINGYPNPNTKNSKPTCSISAYAINGWGIDTVGDLILPGNISSNGEPTINVYQGPALCGKLLGSITDNNGQAADAKSFNATKDNIYVGEILSTSSGTGDVLICSLKKDSCGTPVTSKSITGYGGGVAIDSKGDCWLSSATSTIYGFVLVYWKGCKGAGQSATGTKNTQFGGLFFDTKGNLVSIDATGVVYVYKGCDPKCTLVSSTKLKGASIFGNLNAAGTEMVVGDTDNEQIDVYKYAPSGVKYMYSFNKGLTGTHVETGGFDPTNKQL